MEGFTIKENDGQEHGPMDFNTIRSWLMDGKIDGSTPTRWGNGDWRPLNELPAFRDIPSPKTPAPANASIAPNPSISGMRQLGEEALSLIYPIAKADPWLRIVSVFHFFQAGLLIATLYGTVVCWIPLWLGIIVWRIANAAQNTIQTGNEYSAATTIRSIKQYFCILGIVSILAVLSTLLGIFASLFVENIDPWWWL